MSFKFKKPLLVLTSFLILLIILFFAFFTYLSSKLNYSPQQLSSKLISTSQSSQSDYQFNFLILGYDYRNDIFEDSLNTDTIIFGNYQTATNKIQLLPLPRDLWDYQNKFKINQIYQNALKGDTPISQTKSDFQQIIGQPIDKIMILSTQNIVDITELLGGLDIYLEKGFIDNEYPNQAYIDDPLSKAPIYTTIEFKDGWNHLDKTNLTQFIRSRKSSETAQDGGTDIGRIERQQLLIETLTNKLKSDYLFNNPSQALKLYYYWQNSIQTDFNFDDLLKLVMKQKQKLLNLQIQKHSLTIGQTPQEGQIYHPQTFINKQWVFIPSTPDYSELQKLVSQIIDNQIQDK